MSGRRRSDQRASRRVAVPSAGLSAPIDAEAAFGALGEALESSRRWRRPLTILLVEIDGEATAPRLDEMTGFLAQTLRDSDGVWPLRERQALALLADADALGSASPVDRIRAGLGPDVSGHLMLGQITVPPGAAPDDVLSLAEAALLPLVTG